MIPLNDFFKNKNLIWDIIMKLFKIFIVNKWTPTFLNVEKYLQ